MKTRFSLLLALIVALAAPALAQGTGGDAELTTGVDGAANDTADKNVAGGSVLSFNIASPGGSLVGQTAALAGDLVPNGFPICINLGTGAMCDLNLGSNLFLIFFPTGSILDPTVISGGLEAAFVIPNDSALFASPDDEALRLQAAVTNPAAPLGAEITNYVDHFANKFVVAGPTSDDGNVLVSLGNGFPFYGTVHTQVHVNSNGNLTFGSGDSDFDATEGEMLSDQARIAPLWTDVSPNISGNISICYERSAGGDLVALTVDWVDVPAFSSPGTLNTFSAVLHMSGDVDVAWTAVETQAGTTGLVGLSPGSGISTANDVGNLEALGGPVAGASMQALYHVYDDSCENVADVLPGGMASFTYDAMNSAYTLSTGGTFTAIGLTVDGFSPSSGPDLGGTAVTFTGCGFDFLNFYTVDFGGTVVGATVFDEATLDCVSPAGSGTVDVTVLENGSPVASFPGSFTYIPAGTVVTPGPTTDDGNVNVVFANGNFSFYGVSYTDCFVNSNGNVTFGAGDSDFNETPGEMDGGAPRIAAFYDDCRPPSGGTTITITETLTDIQFAYVDVPAYTTGMNTCIATLDRATGDVSLAYGASSTSFNGVVGSRNVICGISPGGGATLAPVDLNAPVGTVGGATNSMYQWLNDVDGPWDLDGATVNFTFNGTGYTH